MRPPCARFVLPVFAIGNSDSTGRQDIVIFQPQLLGTKCTVISVKYPSIEEASHFDCKFGLLTFKNCPKSLEFEEPILSDRVEFEEKTDAEMADYYYEHIKRFYIK